MRTIVRPPDASRRSRSITLRFRIGSIPVENSSRNTTGVSTMKTLATCTRRRKPPLRSITFRLRLGRQAELFEDAIRAPADLGAAEAVEARERSEVVAHGEKELGGAFLDDDRDPPAHLERFCDDIAVEHRGGAGGRPRERRQNAQERRLAGAVRAEEAEDGAALDVEREPVDRADLRLAAARVHLDEIADTDGWCRHMRLA